MGEAVLAADHAKRPAGGKSVESWCRRNRTGQNLDGSRGDENEILFRRCRLCLLVRLACGLCRAYSVAGRCHRLGRRSHNKLRGWR
jgi:hypothetical protein